MKVKPVYSSYVRKEAVHIRTSSTETPSCPRYEHIEMGNVRVVFTLLVNRRGFAATLLSAGALGFTGLCLSFLEVGKRLYYNAQPLMVPRY